MTNWQDKIVGARMTVDEEFAPRVEDSRFTRQEWGLIMTATTFDVRRPGDEEAAELVADTTDLPSIIPELENVANMGAMGAPQRGTAEKSGGVLDSVLGALGVGGNGDGDGADEEKLEAAEELVDAYAQELQAHLESIGRWDEVRSAAADEKTAE